MMNDLAVSMLGGAGPVQPQLASFLPDWLNPQVFLADPALAPWVVLLVCGIVFAETGLLVGFFEARAHCASALATPRPR